MILGSYFQSVWAVVKGSTNIYGLKFILIVLYSTRERSGSVVEYLTRDQGIAGSSVTGFTVLFP